MIWGKQFSFFFAIQLIGKLPAVAALTDLKLPLSLSYGLTAAKLPGLSCSSGHHSALLKSEEAKFIEGDLAEVRHDFFPSTDYAVSNKVLIFFPIYSFKIICSSTFYFSQEAGCDLYLSFVWHGLLYMSFELEIGWRKLKSICCCSLLKCSVEDHTKKEQITKRELELLSLCNKSIRERKAVWGLGQVEFERWECSWVLYRLQNECKREQKAQIIGGKLGTTYHL